MEYKAANERGKMNHRQHLHKQVESQVKRMKKAERDRPNLLSQTVYIGTLGLLMVLPLANRRRLFRTLAGWTVWYQVIRPAGP